MSRLKLTQRQKITVRDYINMPYDPDEDHLFLSSGKSSDQSNLPTISQIFERIKVLIMSTGSSSVSSTLIGLDGTSTAAKCQSLKTDLQKPFSIVLKYVISSGIEGFKSATNGIFYVFSNFE